jgi:hypothetical protein
MRRSRDHLGKMTVSVRRDTHHHRVEAPLAPSKNVPWSINPSIPLSRALRSKLGFVLAAILVSLPPEDEVGKSSGSIKLFPAISAWLPLRVPASVLGSLVERLDRARRTKSSTALLQTAHFISFSPTILRALVKHAEHKGCVHGLRMARGPEERPQTEHDDVSILGET